jgi:hypothetical protein
VPFPWHRASCRSKLDLDTASPSRAGLKVIGGPFRVGVFGAYLPCAPQAHFFVAGPIAWVEDFARPPTRLD